MEPQSDQSRGEPPRGEPHRPDLKSSLERIGAVSGGLLVLAALAGLLDVTGWPAAALVIVGGLGIAVAVGRWRESRPHSLIGATVALATVVGIAALTPGDQPAPESAPASADPPSAGPQTTAPRPVETTPVPAPPTEFRVPGSFPLNAAVRTSANSCLGWITPVPPAAMSPRPAAEHDDGSWLRALRVVPAEELTVTLTLDTPSEAKVTLHDLRVKVVRRSAPLGGTHLHFLPCGGVVYRFMKVDLDTIPPKITSKVEPGAGTGITAAERQPIRFPYVVSSTDPESFEIIASTSDFDIEFVVEAEWAFQGRTGVLRIDDSGAPFHLSGASGVDANCLFMFDDKIAEVSTPGCPMPGK